MQGDVRAGQLVLIATPLGNLSDLSDRAKHVLSTATVLCCEDTRRTRALLSAISADTSPKRLWAVHDHNEVAQTGAVLDLVASGHVVGVVTDAGMPGIADPGSRLVAAAHDRGLSVSVIPGPSAAISALVVSGLPTERFIFEGFLPRKGKERAQRLDALRFEQRTTVVFEAPGRTHQTLVEFAEVLGAHRPATLVREITKKFETVTRATLGELATLTTHEEVRGEVVLVIGPGEPETISDEVIDQAILRGLGSGERLKDVARAVAQRFELDQRHTYDRARELRVLSQGEQG